MAERLILFYRREISQYTPHCKYRVTCSQYALEAVREFGAWRGSWMAARRLWTCR